MIAKDVPTQPLRDEHRALAPELAAVRDAADAVGSAAGSEYVERARRLLVRHLVPHMDAEEAVLYPAIDRAAGSDVTTSLRRDHDEIRRRLADLAGQSAAPAGSRANDLRAALYGLDAVVQLHVAKEEELYYPILDRQLSDGDVLTVVVAMHEAERAQRARATVG